MADLSSFFPAAGGGGGAVSVGSATYNGSTDLDDWRDINFMVHSENTSHISASNINPFQLSTNSSEIYSVTNTTSYQNLVNITSATNGGALTWLTFFYWSNGVITTDLQPQFKVTIDGGTAVELNHLNVTDSYGKIYAHFGPLKKVFGFDLDENFFDLGYTPHGAETSSTYNYNIDSFYDSTDNVYYVKQNSNASRVMYFLPFYPTQHVVFGLPWVHFTTSLKVEAKINGTTAYGTSYAGVKTF